MRVSQGWDCDECGGKGIPTVNMGDETRWDGTNTRVCLDCLRDGVYLLESGVIEDNGNDFPIESLLKPNPLLEQLPFKPSGGIEYLYKDGGGS